MDKVSGNFKLNLGRIYRHFEIALVLLVGGLFCFLWKWEIALLLLIVSIGIITSHAEIEIDPEKLKYRVIDYIYGVVPIGPWKTFTNNDIVILKRTNYSQVLNSRGTSVTTNVKTYDLILKNKVKEVEIHEFKEYETAKLVFDYIEKQCGLKSHNAVVVFGAGKL